AEGADLVMARGVEQSRQYQQCSGDVVHGNLSDAFPIAFAQAHVPAWREEISFRQIRFAAFELKFDLSGKASAG
ncbi:hypothetical protein, partial [Bradyrhizobium genomosp. III]|uniref:hypothetical protein n=1 Tax=Bradyrhizobium genomosp. III TaxID=2683271 RepID=UPI001AEC4353